MTAYTRTGAAARFAVGYPVWVHAFGAWRRGTVTALGRTRVRVRYTSNNTTGAEREKWFTGTAGDPVMAGSLPEPVSYRCPSCDYALHGAPGVTVEQLRDDHNTRWHSISSGGVS